MADTRQALGSFMDAQVSAHAVPDAVVEVLTSPPQRRARDTFDIPSGQTDGPVQHRQRDHALQDPGETGLFLIPDLANRNGAGDVGGSVQVLTAAVQHQQMAVPAGCCRFLPLPGNA